MVYKLDTQLRLFMFNRVLQNNPINIEWYFYELNQENDDNVRGFTYEELKLFEKYVVSNAVNFDGPKNYHTIQEDEEPLEEIFDMLENDRLMFPSYLILRPYPTLSFTNKISNFMTIKLVNSKGDSNHNYTLPFGAIGKIN